jgi:aminoglycoside phosphotransferase (APT) family kinase protein
VPVPQRVISTKVAGRLVQASFGRGLDARAIRELAGGGFANVSRVDLSDGRTVVLKVPPPPAPMLSYEYGITGAEARYLALVEQNLPCASFPRLLAYGHDPHILDSEWLFMSCLPGTMLSALRDICPAHRTDPVRAQLGRTVARLHEVTGGRFGYDDDRPHGDSWREAFLAIVDSLLTDAGYWEVDLGAPPEDIRRLLARHAAALDVVQRPALLHFDLWDGNVLCVPDRDGALRLSGIVDGERYLWGDPLMDFVSPALYRRIEDEPEHPFVRGYAAQRGHPVTFDASASRRLTLYRLHMYLLMTVEMPSRGMTPGTHPGRCGRLRALLQRQLAALGNG